MSTPTLQKDAPEYRGQIGDYEIFGFPCCVECNQGQIPNHEYGFLSNQAAEHKNYELSPEELRWHYYGKVAVLKSIEKQQSQPSVESEREDVVGNSSADNEPVTPSTSNLTTTVQKLEEGLVNVEKELRELKEKQKEEKEEWKKEIEELRAQTNGKISLVSECTGRNWTNGKDRQPENYDL